MTRPAGAAAARRTEREIFDELAAVCTSQGCAHAIAYLSRTRVTPAIECS